MCVFFLHWAFQMTLTRSGKYLLYKNYDNIFCFHKL